jgi:hypothetical protein
LSEEGVIINISSCECLVSLLFAAVGPEVHARDLIEILEGKTGGSRSLSDGCAGVEDVSASLFIGFWYGGTLLHARQEASSGNSISD